MSPDRPIYLVEDRLVVDVDDSAVKLVGDALRAREVRREDGGSETVFGMIGETYCLRIVAERGHRRHRAKNLLIKGCHSRGDACQYRGREEKALPRAASDQACASRDGLRDHPIHILRLP